MIFWSHPSSFVFWEGGWGDHLCGAAGGIDFGAHLFPAKNGWSLDLCVIAMSSHGKRNVIARKLDNPSDNPMVCLDENSWLFPSAPRVGGAWPGPLCGSVLYQKCHGGQAAARCEVWVHRVHGVHGCHGEMGYAGYAMVGCRAC